MSAQIITIADEIKDIINAGSFSQSFTASRTFVKYERMDNISALEVWVQPIEEIIIPKTRSEDKTDCLISVGVFKRCGSDSEIDEMITLIDEIYRYLRRYEFSDNSKTMLCEIATLYSPEYLSELSLFAGVLNITVTDIG